VWTNGRIIREFVNGAQKGYACNMFIDGPILYSYGRHFPLALRLGVMYVINADKYSITTSHHQTMCIHAMRTRVELAASAFPFDVFHELERGRAVLLDHREGEQLSTYWGDRLPTDLRGWTVTKHKDGDSEYMLAHKAGGALVRHESTYYLCGVDEGSYFVCQLAEGEEPETMEQAFQSLVPQSVLDAQQVGTIVPRQGEWFFIPTEKSTRDLAARKIRRGLCLDSTRQIAKGVPNGERHSTGNLHVPREIRYRPLTKQLYCRGRVVHRDRHTDKATGEHRSVMLGNTWHEAVRNRAVQSWNSVGGFD